MIETLFPLLPKHEAVFIRKQNTELKINDVFVGIIEDYLYHQDGILYKVNYHDHEGRPVVDFVHRMNVTKYIDWRVGDCFQYAGNFGTWRIPIRGHIVDLLTDFTGLPTAESRRGTLVKIHVEGQPTATYLEKAALQKIECDPAMTVTHRRLKN
jgi:hypothetical protein